MDTYSDDPGSDRTLMNLALAYWGSAAVGAVARLGVADHLAQQPQAAGELAKLTGVDESSLRRVLRFLTGAGVFSEDGRGRFHLTPAAEPLLTTSPRSLRAAVSFVTDDLLWQPAGRLTDTLHRGATVFGEIFGMPLWDYLGATPSAGAVFDTGMTSYTGPENAAIADTYDLTEIGSVVDVGGGRGGLLAMLLSRNPHLSGVLYDREPVLDEHLLDRPELAGRWTTVAGDFRDSVPPGSELYILKHILHNWNDEQCVTILQHCRRAMPDDGRILVAETITPPPNTPHYVWALDMVMMALVTGHERTREQFETLFAAAELKLTRVVATATYSSLSLIEATPA